MFPLNDSTALTRVAARLLAPRYALLGIVAVGLVVDVLWWGPRWLRHPGTPGTPTPATPSLVSGALSQLFGVAPPEVSLAIPQTANGGPVALTGTLVFDGAPDRGYAIVTVAGTTQLVAVGAPIGAARLSAVYADHIVIDENGQLTAIALPKAAGGHGGLYGGDEASGPHAPPLQDAPVEELRARIAKATAPLAMLLKAEPLLSDDEYRGLVVHPNGNNYLFERAGFQSDDVLMGVNGIAMTQDNLSLLADEIRTGHPVKVSLMRPGVGMMEVTLRTSGVYVGPKGP
jgi:type II secretory pathway component PulC